MRWTRGTGCNWTPKLCYSARARCARFALCLGYACKPMLCGAQQLAYCSWPRIALLFWSCGLHCHYCSKRENSIIPQFREKTNDLTTGCTIIIKQDDDSVCAGSHARGGLLGNRIWPQKSFVQTFNPLGSVQTAAVPENPEDCQVCDTIVHVIVLI